MIYFFSYFTNWSDLNNYLYTLNSNDYEKSDVNIGSYLRNYDG